MNNMQELLQFIAQGGNPNAYAQRLMQTNPQFAQAYKAMQSQAQASGMTMQQFAMQYARQNGRENDLAEIARRMGIK